MGRKTLGGIMTPINKLEIITKAADDSLAKDIVALEVHELTPLADYFLIMSANNERQQDAIVREIIDTCKIEDIDIKNVEGKAGGRWTLIDLHDIIVHVFHYNERSHYNLENIWKEAPLVNLNDWIDADEFS